MIGLSTDEDSIKEIIEYGKMKQVNVYKAPNNLKLTRKKLTI